MKVFWSWQSDTPGKIGRHFVRDALNAAIERIKADAEVVEPGERDAIAALHLDHDRKDVSGSPDLARTILEKIDQCAVFIADVTPVGRSQIPTSDDDKSKPKHFINSNVAIELGYALRALSDRFLLMVMNDHYGSRDDLPFDLRHKAGPILITLAPDADKTTIETEFKRLVGQLVEALKACASARVRKTSALSGMKRFVGRSALFFTRGAVLATAGEPGEQEFHFDAERAAYLRLFTPQTKTPMTLAKVVKVFNDRRPMPFSMNNGAILLRNKEGAIVFDFAGKGTITALTQGFKTGELWGVNGQVITTHKTNLDGATVIVPMISFEKLYVRVLTNYVRVAEVLGLDPPHTIFAGVTGLEGAYLTVPGSTGAGQYHGPINEPDYHWELSISSRDDKAIMAALKIFFEGLYDLAACERSEVLTDREVAAHVLPSR